MSGNLSRHHLPLRTAGRGGFTLVEMLVASSILLVIIGILFTITQETSKVWSNAAGKVEVFRGARTGFDAATRTLSQATLNTYYDYFDANGVPASSSSYTGTPVTYGRQSHLQLVTGQGSTLLTGLTGYTPVTHAAFFQAPLGVTATSSNIDLGSLLNSCGFYIVYGPDNTQPNFVSSGTRYRYRLMQFIQPSDSLSVYVSGNKGSSNWYLPAIKSDLTSAASNSNFVLAENVIALVFLPKLASQDEAAADTAYGLSAPMGTALAPSYAYDSTSVGQGGSINSSTGLSMYPMLNSFNQLPPVVQVTMVAIDEASAVRLGNAATPPNAKLGLTSTLFTQAKNYQADLNAMMATLAANHINYRVFQTDVAIRGAKWTANN